MSKSIPLKFVWGIYLKFWAEGAKLWAEGDKLRAECAKLRAEGDKLRAEAILEAYGNVTVEWKSCTECVVAGTDVYSQGSNK